MKRSILIVAAIAIGLLSNNVFAQTPTTPTQPTPTQPTPTQPTPTQPTQTQPPATTTPAAKADSVKDLEATVANVADLSTLTAAIKAANLNTTLQGPGPYTVFAPGNAAFSAIPKTRLDSLMKDPAKLATLVKAHVVVVK